MSLLPISYKGELAKIFAREYNKHSMRHANAELALLLKVEMQISKSAVFACVAKTLYHRNAFPRKSKFEFCWKIYNLNRDCLTMLVRQAL